MLICVDHEQVVCVMLYCVFVTCRCVTWVSRGTRLYRFSIFVVDFNKRPGGGGRGVNLNVGDLILLGLPCLE